MSIRRGIVAVIVGMLAVVMLVVLTYVLPVFIQLKLTGEKTTQKSIDFPQPRFTPKPSAPDIVIQPFKRTITDEGVDQLQIKAERAEIEQKDKKFKLKNITEAIFYGQDDRNYIVSAKEGIWDQNERFVKIQGDVEIDIISEDDPVDISAEWITYNFPMKILDGGGGIKLRSGPYYSEGDRIAVNMVDDRITLDSRVKTLIEPSAFKKSSFNIEEPVQILARQLRYYHNVSSLKYMGYPIVRSGNNTLKGAQIIYDFGKGQYLMVDGDVELNIQITPGKEGPEAPTRFTANMLKIDINGGEILFRENVLVKQPNSSLSADQIRLQLDSHEKEIVSATAEGNVFYRHDDVFASADQILYDPLDQQFILSGSSQIIYEEKNQLNAHVIRLYADRKFYVADEQVMITFVIPDNMENDDKQMLQPKKSNQVDIPNRLIQMPKLRPNVPVQIRCNRAEVDEIKGAMVLFEDVRGRQEDYRFGCDELHVSFDPENQEVESMIAIGNVHLAQEGGVATGDKLVYKPKIGTFDLSGSATVWQGDNQIQAEHFTYYQKEAIVTFTQNVRLKALAQPMSTADTDQSREKMTQSPIKINADRGSMNQVTGDTKFDHDVSIKWEDWTIKSNHLNIVMNTENNQIQKVFADGTVEAKRGDLNAVGDSLTYFANDSIITLRGSNEEKCKVWMGERGSQAEEFRYYLEEDRFEIDEGLSVMIPSQLDGLSNE